MYRISKKEKGWIVEKQVFKYCFLGLHFYKVWRPYIKSFGLDSCWHHSNINYAKMSLHSEILDKELIIDEFEKKHIGL